MLNVYESFCARPELMAREEAPADSRRFSGLDSQTVSFGILAISRPQVEAKPVSQAGNSSIVTN